jgi:hypothetical protein
MQVQITNYHVHVHTMGATCNNLQLGCEGSSYHATEKNEIQALTANTICVIYRKVGQ